MDDSTNQATPQWQSPQRKPRLSGLSRRAATALTAAGLMIGGMAGGYIVSHAATSSSSAISSPSSTNGSSGTTAPSSSQGTFHPNEDATHEAGESAAREAQENAGQFPTVP